MTHFMKRQLQAIFLLIILSFFSCNENECKDRTMCGLTPIDVSYFGKFPTGCLWIYRSFGEEDKTDSVYFYNYKETRYEQGEPSCTNGMGYHMRISSNHLGYNQYSFQNFVCEARTFLFYIWDSIYSKQVEFTSDSEKYEGATILSSLTIPTRDTLIMPSEDTLKIPPFDTILVPSTEIYHNVLYKDNLWLASEVGIIKFISPETQDTFFLQKIYTF